MGNCTQATCTPTAVVLTQSETSSIQQVVAKCDYEPQRIPIPKVLAKWISTENATSSIRQQFEWDGEIGRGVAASVHSVRHQDIECAVKQIKRGNKWTEMECALETRILSDFHHEGIIGFVDVYLDEEYIYLAMERADHDLHHVLRTSG